MDLLVALIVAVGTPLLTIRYVKEQIGRPLDFRLRDLENEVKQIRDYLEANNNFKVRR